MKNLVENMAIKYHSQVTWLSLGLAFLAIAFLNLGGADAVAIKIKHTPWQFFPLYILAFYLFVLPLVAPLLDYWQSSKKDEVELLKAYRRVLPKSKPFLMMAMSWIVALVLANGAYKSYEVNLTVRSLEQNVCLLKMAKYSPRSSARACFI